ncbi:hypothetical protein DVH24_038837 [Malus domestica]|uniref:Uncharacterized protein n=1 Tax=Malus domestica TaxID=3750 RepID=A0A498KGG0_MALDO|nr:hypothetical protein DVH24_038837 [Malus domestica]
MKSNGHNQANHFYTPTASSEALQPQKHFSLPTSAPPIYPHSPNNPSFFPNKISTICFLVLKDFFLFKSLLPTPTAYPGKNSVLAIASFLGLSFRTPLLQVSGNVSFFGGSYSNNYKY